MAQYCPPRNQCAPSSGKGSESKPPNVVSPPEPLFGNPLKHFGAKQMTVIKAFLPSMLIWSAYAFTAMVFYTDWKAITRWIPFYNGKFATDDEGGSSSSSKTGKNSKSDGDEGESAAAGGAAGSSGSSGESSGEGSEEGGEGSDKKVLLNKKRNDEC